MNVANLRHPIHACSTSLYDGNAHKQIQCRAASPWERQAPAWPVTFLLFKIMKFRIIRRVSVRPGTFPNYVGHE
jgi:hypothetical protein